ncbi:glycosyl hydrolase family 61-domain-containing protein [Mycena capillaripes]|nr:glycosyl hydrolase family 61-domain-containing protein [Mycena capillaripes]
MKFFSVLVAVAALVAKVSAHYTWPNLIVGGTNTSTWQYVRQTNNWQDLNPAMDVTSTDIRCYDSLQSGTASTATVAAGSTVGFTVVGNPSNLYHAGVVNVYMAKAPAGIDVANWDGSGEVWFKVFQIPAIADGVTFTFPSEGLAEVIFPIPAQTPSGQYAFSHPFFRFEIPTFWLGSGQFILTTISLSSFCSSSTFLAPKSRSQMVEVELLVLSWHSLEHTLATCVWGSPRLYYQLTILPQQEPGILINIYWPIPTSYIQPGPPVWPAAGSGGAAPPTSTSSTIIKTTPPVTSTTTVVTTTTKASTTTTSSTGSSTGTPVAQWGQCG